MGRVLVSGSNGRLGRVVASKLADPVLLQRASARLIETFEKTEVISDQSGAMIRGDLSEISAVINCAGLVKGHKAELEQANVTFAAGLARSAKANGVKKFIQVSSISVYGNAELMSADTPLTPTSEYGRSKLAGEQMLEEISDENFEVSYIRLPFMFSHDHPGMLKNLIWFLATFRVFPKFNHIPDSRRSMITFNHAAEELIGLTDTVSPKALAIADPHKFSIDWLIDQMAKEIEVHVKRINLATEFHSVVNAIFPRINDRLFKGSEIDNGINRHNADYTTSNIQLEIVEILKAYRKP